MRILVVDDDLIQQQVLACLLTRHGFSVETALTGLEAIRKAREGSYHVVLLDQTMPDVDGQSAARVIGRGRDGNRYPWLIAVSANLQQIVQDEETAPPAFDILIQKPWKPDHLLALLKKCDRPPPGEAARGLMTTSERNLDYSVSESAIAARYAKYCNREETSSPSMTRLLLVDRDPALLTAFSESLAGRGYRVDTVGSRDEALQRISAGCYDVVLADYLKLNRFCGTPAAYVGTEAGSPSDGGVVELSRVSTADVSPLDERAPRISPLHVLIADDVGLNQDVIASILRSVGHQVTCVDGGSAAVAAAQKADIDVILMDIRMPDIDGFEATRRIRAGSELWTCVPIIALTTQAPPDQLAQLGSAGMDGYLLKPFERDNVIAVVTRAGSIKQRECDRYYDLTAGPANSADSAPTIVGGDLRTIDREILDRTRSYLGDQKTASYLQTLAANAWSFLQKLKREAPDIALANAVVDEAHSLGGSAGMFGFTRLLQVSQGFERAVGTAAPDIPEHVQGLIAAIEVTLEMLDRLQ